MQGDFAVQLSHIKKWYNGKSKPLTIFEDVTFNIRKKECLAIMGPTGCGKTTLLNLIAGFDQPQSGEIYIDGINIVELSENVLTKLRAEKLGFIFQLHNLLQNLTVYENVELPLVLSGWDKERRKKRVTEVLERAWINQYADRKVKTLSVGEWQLVALARALVKDPEIILMDEPLEYLDPLTTDMLIAFLKGEIMREKTILLTTHKRKVANMAENVIHLKKRIP